MGTSQSKQKAAVVKAVKVQVTEDPKQLPKLQVTKDVLECGVAFAKEVYGQPAGTIGAVIALLNALGQLDKGVAKFIRGASAELMKRDAELLAMYMKATLAALHVASDLRTAVAKAGEQVRDLSVALNMLNDGKAKSAVEKLNKIKSERLVLPDSLMEQLQDTIQAYDAVINLCKSKLEKEIKQANKQSNRYLLLSGICMFGAMVVIGATIAVPLAAPAALALTYGLLIGGIAAVTAAGVVITEAMATSINLYELQTKLKKQEELVRTAAAAADSLSKQLQFLSLEVGNVQKSLENTEGVLANVVEYGRYAAHLFQNLDIMMLLKNLESLDTAANNLHGSALSTFQNIAEQAKWDETLRHMIDKGLDALMRKNRDKEAVGKK